ncbi:hypothetical protein OX284_004920 [Flavobacterium sp. SUN046]|uniref:DUF6712 family protein n=1 Tax=Flavobacterium sp. SUN046 TaxID=3002440 RepID=UPI002DB71032|nr:hypothetical protein [Flavobacterium sp. SUN046]MEC4048763.1 hypothetical protein [Flavobacterium sp. SUN046]
MNNLITPAEFQSAKDIGHKLDEKKINSLIEMAQSTDLKELLSARFYFDLLDNQNEENYQDLLSGCTFQFLGVNYYQDGLKALLCDYVMAKYVLQVNTNFTPFGVTIKTSENSEPVDRNTLKDIAVQNTQLAGSRFEIIKLYLDTNWDKFPNWINNIYSSEVQPTERTYRLRKIS